VIVISRFLPSDAEEFLDRAGAALRAFADRPGFLRGRVGRAVDDPDRWVLVTEWDSVGSFRRSLSAYEVKLHAAPLLASSIEEPAAYEPLISAEDGVISIQSSALAADSGSVRVGEAAGPSIPWDFPGR
jgi:quinol monooxygenase YgiN